MHAHIDADAPRMMLRRVVAGAGFGLLLSALTSVGAETEQNQGCMPSPNVPLPDLVQPYRGLMPGMYPGGLPAPDTAHVQAGITRSTRIAPLDVNGRPSAGGQIILLSIGMSNTVSEFERFIQMARITPALNRRVSIVNGALSGADADLWSDPKGAAWQHVGSALRGRYAPAQVQVIWMKQARLRTAPFPDEVEEFASGLDATLRTARSQFPNLRLVYVSSRTRSGATTRGGPGEPQAYESAFAVRRLIEREQGRRGEEDGAWVSWGPYLWANATERSDGFTWECADLQRDLLHPSESGSQKVAQQLLAFFMTDPTAAPWFLENSSRRQEGPAAQVKASVLTGPAPLVVDFASNATWPTSYYWTFGDGTSSLAAQPRKRFSRDGVYDVQVTLTDSAGRWARSSARIRVER